MRRNRPFAALILLMIAMIAAVTFLMFRESAGTTAPAQVYVIIENSNDNRWVQFIEGMQQAAEDAGISLTIMPTGHIETLSEEETLVERAIANGTDGVILQLCSTQNAAQMLERLSSRTSIELVNEDAYGVMSNIAGMTSPDHKAMGEAIAREVEALAGGSLEKHTIGVIRGSLALSSMDQRLDGFTQELESRGGKAAWVVVQTDDAKSMKELLAQQVRPDILVALDNTGLEVAAEYAASLGENVAILGIGTSMKSLYYLDSGIVQSIVVPEDYMMGYQSVSDLAEFIHRNRFLPKVQTIQHRIIHKDTLFAEENQEILFPVQR